MFHGRMRLSCLICHIKHVLPLHLFLDFGALVEFKILSVQMATCLRVLSHMLVVVAVVLQSIVQMVLLTDNTGPQPLLFGEGL